MPGAQGSPLAAVPAPTPAAPVGSAAKSLVCPFGPMVWPLPRPRTRHPGPPGTLYGTRPPAAGRTAPLKCGNWVALLEMRIFSVHIYSLFAHKQTGLPACRVPGAPGPGIHQLPCVPHREEVKRASNCRTRLFSLAFVLSHIYVYTYVYFFFLNQLKFANIALSINTAVCSFPEQGLLT